MPRPGGRDAWGGATWHVNQCDWGHRAEKSTWLYVVGYDGDPRPRQRQLSLPVAVVGTSRLKRHIPEITRREREATPPNFARFLVHVARQCDVS